MFGKDDVGVEVDYVVVIVYECLLLLLMDVFFEFCVEGFVVLGCLRIVVDFICLEYEFVVVGEGNDFVEVGLFGYGGFNGWMWEEFCEYGYFILLVVLCGVLVLGLVVEYCFGMIIFVCIWLNCDDDIWFFG